MNQVKFVSICEFDDGGVAQSALVGGHLIRQLKTQ
jgi:hypothetical protein